MISEVDPEMEATINDKGSVIEMKTGEALRDS